MTDCISPPGADNHHSRIPSGTWVDCVPLGLRQAVEGAVEAALQEDLQQGDLTSRLCIPPDARCRAVVEARAPMTLAGLFLVRYITERISPDCAITPAAEGIGEGSRVSVGSPIIVIEGNTAAVLAGERTALNFLGRLCGVATITRQYVDAVRGTAARIVDTRKTTPGLRVLEKYAVRCGGGANHRFSLGDGILIKDNHIAACGGVREAVERARTGAPHLCRVEVEVTSMEELEQALQAGADVVLLDNMSPTMVASAAQQCRNRALVEVSGGVTLGTVRSYAEAGADFISAGALTHSAPCADLSLEMVASLH